MLVKTSFAGPPPLQATQDVDTTEKSMHNEFQKSSFTV